MAVYPLTMIPRFRKRNREREQLRVKLNFTGNFPPPAIFCLSSSLETPFGSLSVLISKRCSIPTPSWLNWKILFSSLIYIKSIFAFLDIEKRKKDFVRLSCIRFRNGVKSKKEKKNRKVDANYDQIILLTRKIPPRILSYVHSRYKKTKKRGDGVSRDFSSSIINSFLLHVKRTT